MKKSLLVLAFAILAGFSSLPAQTPGDAPAGEANAPAAAPQPASPPRDIMPRGINHKPNATQPPAEIAASIDKFFKTLKGGDYVTAFDGFLGGTRLGAQTQKKSNMISHTQEIVGVYGQMRDYEIFDNYGIGSNVLVLTYLTRHDLQPLRWRFIYYRADKTWTLINMGVDDVLLDMLD